MWEFSISPSVILSQEEVQLLPSKVSGNVQAFKITYLSDGLRITGFVVKPKAIESKAPLIIYNRGGSEDRGVITDTILSGFLSFYASLGYVILASQYRGNAVSEGQDEFGGSDVNDVLNLLDVARELPYIDMDTKFMMGHSRGGMMTYLAIRTGIDIRAAAIVCGVTDFLEAYHAREQVMKEICNRLVGEPSRNEESYKKRSATYWADEINVPVLILHGAKDMNVPVEQVREFVRKLADFGKDYTYIEYPDGDHSLRQYGREYTQTIDDFFKRYL